MKAEQSMSAFLIEHKITMMADLVDANPNMPDPMAGSTHWKCQLRCRGRRLTVHFTMGPAHSREPEAADVLDCLASDAAGVENARDFEDWCGEYGYDTDSRKAEATYRACEQQAAGLKRLLGEDAYQALLFSTERL